MAIDKGDRVLYRKKGDWLDNHLATVTSSTRQGWRIKVDGLIPEISLNIEQGMECLDKLTAAQESVLALPPQVYDPDLGWQDLPKKTNSAPKYSNLDIPESPTMATSNSSKRGRGRPPKRSLSGLVLSEAEVAEVAKAQLDLTSKIQWIDPDQLEEVSFTQIRHSIDSEAIARYAELMRDNLWDFERQPLPVLFEHENRLLIGDGHHRIEAARKHKLKIKCEIFTAWSIEEALLYSIRAVENLNHGIPLRPKDQRKRITMFLDLLDEGKISIFPPEGFQEWSARAIATYLRLPESGYRTVASIRKQRAIAAEEEEARFSQEKTAPTLTFNSNDPSIFPEIPADTYTSPPTLALSGAERNTPVDTTFQPSLIPAHTYNPLSLPTPPARLTAMVMVILDQIDELEKEQLTALREAIEAEEVRRLEQIMREKELLLSEVEVKGSH